MVPHWDRFQHYADRDPLWIKVYTELNSRDEWLQLSTAERGMLTTIWVEYARSAGQLRVQKVMQLCGKSARSKHVDSLNHAGFIQVVASKPLALTRSREKRREEKKEKRASTQLRKAPNMPATDEAAYVRGLIANNVITEPYELDAYNLDDALKIELAAQL